MTPNDFLLSIPKQDRARAALTRILDAGREILADDGLPALTTDDIARRAEVNIATFYKYFANREALLGYLAVQLILRLCKWLLFFGVLYLPMRGLTQAIFVIYALVITLMLIFRRRATRIPVLGNYTIIK